MAAPVVLVCFMDVDPTIDDTSVQSPAPASTNIKISVNTRCERLPFCDPKIPSTCAKSTVCRTFWVGSVCTCEDGMLPNRDGNGILTNCMTPVYGPLTIAPSGITPGLIAVIILYLLVLLAILTLLILYVRKHTSRRSSAESHIANAKRDALSPDDLEGGGESNDVTYDINVLRRPRLSKDDTYSYMYAEPTVRHFDFYQPLRFFFDPDEDAPVDECRSYKMDDSSSRSRGNSLSTLHSALKSSAASPLDIRRLSRVHDESHLATYTNSLRSVYRSQPKYYSQA